MDLNRLGALYAANMDLFDQIKLAHGHDPLLDHRNDGHISVNRHFRNVVDVSVDRDTRDFDRNLLKINRHKLFKVALQSFR